MEDLTEDRETEITSPRNIAESRTEKKGSMALIVCVNDTATFPRLMLVKRLPMVWTTARGRIARSWEIRAIRIHLLMVQYMCTESLSQEPIITCAPEIFGLLRIPVAHINKEIVVPTAN